MKQNSSFIIILLSLVLANLNGQNIENDEILEHLVKIQCSSMCTNGNGIIVGIDEFHIYIVTAAHVVDSTHLENNEDDIIPKLQVIFKKRKIGLKQKIQRACITNDIEVLKEYSELDLAILKVKHSLPERFYNNRVFKGINNILIRGHKPSFYLQGVEEVTIKGYPSAATISEENFTNKLLTVDFFDNLKYFKIVSDHIEEGHSGSPVFSGPYLSGILLETTPSVAKVLHLGEIITKLKKDKINHNLLSLPKIMNYKWRINKVEILKNNDVVEFIEKDTLMIQFTPKGEMMGFINGNYDINNSNIFINNIKPENNSYSKKIPSITNPGFFNSIDVITTNSSFSTVEINSPFAFNFSNLEDNFIIEPLERIIIKSPSVNILLEEVRD